MHGGCRKSASISSRDGPSWQELSKRRFGTPSLQAVAMCRECEVVLNPKHLCASLSFVCGPTAQLLRHLTGDTEGEKGPAIRKQTAAGEAKAFSRQDHESNG